MAELLIFEFDGVGEADYDRVNEILGIDSTRDEGEWPAGLITHTAAPLDDGWIVVELWETREDQEEFMRARLGPALQKAGVDKPPKRASWSKAKAHRSPRKPSARRSSAVV